MAEEPLSVHQVLGPEVWMLAVLFGVVLAASASAGTYVDLATKERLVFSEEGIAYSSRGETQALRVEGPTGQWPLTVRFQKSDEPYVLDSDEGFGGLSCRNPDGTTQLFLRQDDDGAVRRASPAPVPLQAAPGKPERAGTLLRDETILVVDAREGWFQVRTLGRTKNVAGWVKASLLRTRPCNAAGWCREALPSHAAISSITGLFALEEADVWVFGNGVLHWDGREWSKAKVPGDPPISAVWGPRPNLLWALGLGGLILRWNGARWTEVPSGTEENLTDLWGSSDKDVWVVGEGGTFLHWDGSAWTRTVRDGVGGITRLWGFGPADVWAVGSGGALLHWDGREWTPFSSPVSSTFTDVWGPSSNNVFAISESCELVRWNGKEWGRVDVATGACTDGFRSIRGTDAAHVWLTTGDGLVFWNGRAWAFVDLTDTFEANIRAVRNTTTSEWWALGDVGNEPALLRLNAVSATPLLITGHPASEVVRAGEPATFEVTAIGSGPLHYQWRRDQVPLPGATGTRYVISATTSADDGAAFDVIVTDPLGVQRVSGRATLVTSGRFGEAPRLTTPRQAHQVTLLDDGKVLVTGGAHHRAIALATTEVFDPVKKKQQETGPLATPRRFHTATALQGGAVLVVGGQSPTAYLATAELYDLRTGKFAPAKGALDTPRAFHTATRLADGKVLLVGGRWGDPREADAPDDTLLKSAAVFEPAKGLFSVVGPMTVPRVGHTATLLRDGSVLVAGGIVSGRPTTVTSTAELYDPRTATFAKAGTLVVARTNHTATLLADGRVLLTGGSTGTEQTATAELFDPATGTFSTTGPLPHPMQDHTATLLPSGKVLVAGGVAGPHAWPSAAELFSPATQTFRQTGSLGTARYDHQALLLPDGKVLISGGVELNTATGAQELFWEAGP